jgi:hypothetical protein
MALIFHPTCWGRRNTAFAGHSRVGYDEGPRWGECDRQKYEITRAGYILTMHVALLHTNFGRLRVRDEPL